MEKVNLAEKLSLFSDYFNPRIAGELNGQQVKLVKFKGEFVWHHHEQEDELFYLEFVDHSYMTLHGFSKLEYNRKKQEERISCAGLPITEKSPLTGKNLIESAIGAKTKCLVVGLEREGQQVVNPEATTVLKAGDTVWLVGEEKPVSKLIEQNVLFL